MDGTPADCIYLALKKILPRNPDLIISGINRGPNLGQQDISYSGTVAAAIQGTFLEIPSLAASCFPMQGEIFVFAAGVCVSWPGICCLKTSSGTHAEHQYSSAAGQGTEDDATGPEKI